MSASESPDPKSNVSEASASSRPPVGEAGPSEGTQPERKGGSRISQAPTVCGDESDLDLGDKAAADASSAATPASGEVEVAGSEASESPEANPEAPTGDPEAEPPPEDPLDIAKAEAKRYREQLIRTAADFDNYKKRARREQDEATRRGKEGVLKDLLPIFDNLERAAGHADKTQDVKSLSDGLRMVLKQFEQAVERIGIVRVASVGKPFDPTVHEAIQHLESTEHVAGVVMTEVQSGYKLGNHLIRACMVVVSKGPGPVAAETADIKDSADAGSAEPGSVDAGTVDAQADESGDADEAPASGEQSKD